MHYFLLEDLIGATYIIVIYFIIAKLQSCKIQALVFLNVANFNNFFKSIDGLS